MAGLTTKEKQKEAAMLRWLLAMLLAFSLFATAGCFTRNVTHNRRHLKGFNEELKALHEDIDFTAMYPLGEPE